MGKNIESEKIYFPIKSIFPKVLILLLAMLLLTGCPGEDKTYITAKEQYAVGWILHNINDNTPTKLDYGEKDFAVYNYSFGYPSGQPQYFADLIGWLPPTHKRGGVIAAATHIHLSIPLDRVYYVKGENPVPENYGGEYKSSEWSFSKSIYLNYLKSNDPPEKFSPEQFGLDVNHEEHYLSQKPSQGITPVPGDRRHIYFGKAPYTPASFIVENNKIRLNGHPIRGYGNNSYPTRRKNVTTFSSDKGIVSFILPMPEYKIYHDGILETSGELTDFNPDLFQYHITKDGKYAINMSIPTNYPVWNNTIITAEIKVPAKESQPPELQRIEVEPFFEEGKEIQILVDLHDESGISSLEIFASSGNDWKKLDTKLTDAKNYIYGASHTPSENQEMLNLRIAASDTLGNLVSYTILPVALPSRTVKFNLAANKDTAAMGDIISFSGRCRISENEFCNNFLLDYYINNESVATEHTSYKLTASSNYDTSAGGDFTFEWKVPLDFKEKEINFKVKYGGTGVYLPHEETIKIPVETFDYDLGIFDLRINGSVFSDYFVINQKAKERLNVSGTVRNLGQNNAKDSLVLFKVDGNAIEKKSISEMAAGKESIVAFEWLPETESYHTIGLEVEYKEDANPNNDKVSKSVYIKFISSDVYAIVKPQDTATLGEEINISIIAYNFGEETAENVTAYLYGFYKPKNIYLSYSPNDEKGTKIAPSSIDYNGTRYDFSAAYNSTKVIVNISTDGFSESLSFSSKEKIKKMSNGIYLFMDYFSSLYASTYIGNASETKKSIGSLKPFDQKEENIDWSAMNTGKHMLVLFLDSKEDNNFDNNYDYGSIDVLNEGINVKAKFAINYLDKYFVGNKSAIKAIISNDGTEEAKNTLVTLFEQKYSNDKSGTKPHIRNPVIGSSKIDSLKAQDSVELSFNWTPSQVNWNYLLLIAESKKDIHPADNDALISVYVAPKGFDIKGYLFYPKDDIFVNKSTLIKGSVFNAGEDESTNISAALYEVLYELKSNEQKSNEQDSYNKNFNSARRLIGNKSIGTLKPDSSLEMSFNWTPSLSGRIYLELALEADNEGNKENNKYSLYIDANVQDVDVDASILSYQKFIIVNESTFVNVYLKNFGNKPSGKFNLSLRANGTVVDSLISKSLPPGEAQFYSLNWNPSEDGTYEIEAVADLSDAEQSNNIDKDVVNVYIRKEINLSFVDKNGDYVARTVLLGDYEISINGKGTFVVPDTPLEMWIFDEKRDDNSKGVISLAASVYENTSIGNSVIASSHITKPVFKDGLALYEIFANNDTWDYGHFSGKLSSELQELNLRYTELKAFACNDYDFGNDTCSKWEQIPSETIVYKGTFMVFANTDKAQAFGIGEKDYDDDSSPDWDDYDNDNDGINDENDSFTCHEGKLKSNKEDVTENQSEVSIKEGTNKLAEFNIDALRDRIDCRQITAQKQPNATKRGYTLLSGVLLANETKTLYVDKIAAQGKVCIKDEEVESIDEVSQKCDGNNERMIQCDGKAYGNYMCTDEGRQYKVEGLMHSAVTEPPICTESWTCAGWGGCGGGVQQRACTDSNGCGTNFNMPNKEQSCSAPSSSGTGRSGARSRYFTYQLGNIKEWHDGKSQTLALELYDLASFDFSKRFNSMILEWVGGSGIRITLSFRNEMIAIKLGESKNFDLDFDGKDDISLTYDGSSKNKADIILSRINPDFIETITIPEIQKSEGNIQKNETAVQTEKSETVKELPKKPISKTIFDIGKGALTEKKMPTLQILAAIIFAGLAITALLLALNASRKRDQYKQQGIQGKTDKLKNIESYIKMESDKGFSRSMIKKNLKRAGWSDDDIGKAMDKIKRV